MSPLCASTHLIFTGTLGDVVTIFTNAETEAQRGLEACWRLHKSEWQYNEGRSDDYIKVYPVTVFFVIPPRRNTNEGPSCPPDCPLVIPLGITQPSRAFHLPWFIQSHYPVALHSANRVMDLPEERASPPKVELACGISSLCHTDAEEVTRAGAVKQRRPWAVVSIPDPSLKTNHTL